MATRTVNNRFIREIERRGPRPQFGDVAYTGDERAEAKRIGDLNAKTALFTNPSGAGVAGGKDWQDFEQYHGYQRQLAAGRGGKHTVNAQSISGGGDINQRALNGDSDTVLVSSGGRRPAAGAGVFAMPQAARPTATGNAPAWLETLRADAEAAQLRDAIHGAETQGRLRQQTMTDRALAAMHQAQNYEGSQNATRRKELDREFAREEGSRDTWQASKDKSGTYWAHGEPVERNQFGQRRDLAEINAIPAQIAANSRMGVAQTNQTGANYRSELQTLSDLVASLQRGESGAHGFNDPRAAQLGGEFDAARGLAQSRVQSGAGGATPPQPGMPMMPAAAAPGAALSEPGAPDFGPEMYGPRVRGGDGSIWEHLNGRWVREE